MAEFTRITTIENENWEDKASKFIYIKEQIWESQKLWVVRNIEWISIVFQIEKILKIC